MDAFSITVAFGLGFAARQIGLPPLVGYLVAGFALHGLNVQGGATLATVSDLGITLLLFSIGLKLRLSTLARPEVWAVTTLHMVLASAVTALLLWLCASWITLEGDSALSGQAIWVVAFALSFSSTVFAVKALEERGDMTARHGRVAVGILIMQDLFAVAYLAVAGGKTPTPWAIGLLALLVLRPLLNAVMSRCGHGELLLLFGLSLAIGGSEVFELVGVKGDLGALILGVLMAPHAKASELAKSLLGFKDIFLIGFFLSIGLSGIPDWHAVVIALGLLAVLVLKAGLMWVLLLGFRLRFRTSVLASLDLATYSEFGLIVTALAAKAGFLPETWITVLALAVSLSFVAAAPLNVHARTLYVLLDRRLRGLERRRRLPGDESIDLGGARILVCGMGRVGGGAYDELASRHDAVVIGVERDEERVESQRAAGRNVIRGEGTDPEFWGQVARANLDLVLLAMPNHTENLFAAEQLRSHGYGGVVCATAQFADEVEALQAAGVSQAYDIRSGAGAGLADLASERFAAAASSTVF